MGTTKFRKRGNRKRMAQSFDKEKITFKRAFGEVNVYDFIQEGREDTEIYPTLEKYGSLEPMKLKVEHAEEMYKDFTQIQELGGYRGVLDYQKKAKEMFYNLPSEIRKEFNNDINKFTKEGPEYLNKKIQEMKKLYEKTIETPETKGEN